MKKGGNKHCQDRPNKYRDKCRAERWRDSQDRDTRKDDRVGRITGRTGYWGKYGDKQREVGSDDPEPGGAKELAGLGP